MSQHAGSPGPGTTSTEPANPSRLREHEIFWRDHQGWLKEKGYLLRARYHSDWAPSWGGEGVPPPSCEDSIVPVYPNVLDATRISDGKIVTLKKISSTTHPHELELSTFFSKEPIASNPRNHCIRISEVLDVPDADNLHILVMPLLRRFNSPSFKTAGEAVDCFGQIFEVFVVHETMDVLHSQKLDYRVCNLCISAVLPIETMNLNIMMDPTPLYPNLYHPLRDTNTRDMRGPAKHHNRTAHPTRYYLIDFGLSRKYNPDDGPPLEPPIRGGDKTVPEFQHSAEPCDPFPTDIYYLGNMIREDFLQVFNGLEFMSPLVADMVQDDPKGRPTIDEVVTRFVAIRKELPWWKLRSRLVDKNDFGLYKAALAVRHFFRTVGYMATMHPAIPSPS